LCCAGKLLTGNIGSLCEQQPLKALRADQLRDHTGKKRRYLARFKGNNTRRPLFFSACVGMWY
jgi:hypothetical protein